MPQALCLVCRLTGGQERLGQFRPPGARGHVQPRQPVASRWSTATARQVRTNRPGVFHSRPDSWEKAESKLTDGLVFSDSRTGRWLTFKGAASL
jgi:hypothetical protein